MCWYCYSSPVARLLLLQGCGTSHSHEGLCPPFTWRQHPLSFMASPHGSFPWQQWWPRVGVLQQWWPRVVVFGGQETGCSPSCLTTGLFSGISAKVTSSTILSLHQSLFPQANKNKTVLRCAASSLSQQVNKGGVREKSVKTRETTLSNKSEDGA